MHRVRRQLEQQPAGTAGFAGSDPELAVGFRFEPAMLEVAPAATGSVLVSVTAAGPEPGQEISRPLTITALDGNRRDRASGRRSADDWMRLPRLAERHPQ
jgi:hypothetical protein